MIEGDAVCDLEMVRRIQGDAFVATSQGNRTPNLEVAAGRFKSPDTGFLNQVDERRRAAVHDRYFGRIQLDDDVVDPEADQCGEQMLDGIYAHRVAHQAGRVTDRADMIDGGRDLETTEIRTPETNTGTGGCRLEREGHLATRMQTNSRAGCGSFKCPLCAHRLSGPSGR